ncbi:unnamed protein product [Schistosoma curassoni]|uniref:Uncharacterized protein n=1 Tax=Schistosoma curassoni TaxID=6186 RepID=A0A183K0G8_9TREM|nr:unnamed protein product [Schistosoma curassoni]
MDGGKQENSERVFRSISDSSTGCTGNPELPMTLGLDPSIARLKHHHVMQLATEFRQSASCALGRSLNSLIVVCFYLLIVV